MKQLFTMTNDIQAILLALVTNKQIIEDRNPYHRDVVDAIGQLTKDYYLKPGQSETIIMKLGDVSFAVSDNYDSNPFMHERQLAVGFVSDENALCVATVEDAVQHFSKAKTQLIQRLLNPMAGTR